MTYFVESLSSHNYKPVFADFLETCTLRWEIPGNYPFISYNPVFFCISNKNTYHKYHLPEDKWNFTYT